MTGDHGDLTADDLITERARLAEMRRGLGASLADYREAARVSQTELAKALDRSPSMVSKAENGEKCLSAPLWEIADQVCTAQGALLAEYREYAEAERDVRARWQNHHREKQRPTRLARAAAARKARKAGPATGAVCALLGDTGDAPSQRAVLVAGARAQEMMAMFDSLVRAFGRRRAIQILSLMTATVGLADLDEHTRIARAVDDPDRIDSEVVRTLWATLTQTRRLYDCLGPGSVLDSFLGQHQLIHHLLHGGAAGQWHRQLRVLDSAIALQIGHCLGHLLDQDEAGVARGWYTHARKAAHAAGNPAYAACAAGFTSWAAQVAGDTRAALDAAADARKLTARSSDPQIEALVESYAAGAHALAGDYDACMAAVDRAHDLLTTAPAPAPGAPAYWVSHPSVDNLLSSHLVLLNRPREAVEAASATLAHFDRKYVTQYAKCEVRLGRALVLAKEIPEAARVLGSAARHADLSPRLTAELRDIRALLQPCAGSRPVQDLDSQLHAYGLNGHKPPGDHRH